MSRLLSGSAMALALAVLLRPAVAQTPTAQPPAGQTPAAQTSDSAVALAQVLVEDDDLSHPLSATSLGQERLQSHRIDSDDTAGLFADTPGVSLATGGGVSSLPIVHGLADDRIRTEVDGMTITSACPNHMNPALSYLPPSAVAAAEVLAGLTPVSAGGDSIAGTIRVESAPPVFADPGETVHTSGSLSGFYRSNANGFGGSVAANAATQNVSLGYAGDWSQADDYDAGNGRKVLSTSYKSENQSMRLAFRHDDDLFEIQAGQQYIPYEGFANQRMDLTGNRGKFVNTHYLGTFDWGTLDARAFWHGTQHAMNFMSDKGGDADGGMPMNTDGTDLGYTVKAEYRASARDTFRFGNEFERYKLTDWWPAVPGSMMMGPMTYLNVADGTRDRLGTFAEWEAKWSNRWTTLLGLRNDTVWSDTGDVQPYDWTGMMNMADAAAARAFNAVGHARTDVDFDTTALARYKADDMADLEFGYARKTRAPNLYERYAWGQGAMSSSMISWFGDGNAYIGNLDLKPEIANTVSATAAFHDAANSDWSLKVTPYYTYVENYIGVDKLGNFGTNFSTLRFANHDSYLYGVDLSGRAGLVKDAPYGDLALSGLLGWVKGEQVNTGASLYHLMPLNAKLALEHRFDGWSSAVEWQLVEAKTDVDPLRKEPTTPGYGLVNLRTSYQWKSVRVDFSIENLFDKFYYLPLGGVDYADYRANGGTGLIGELPGMGRSFNIGTTITF